MARGNLKNHGQRGRKRSTTKTTKLRVVPPPRIVVLFEGAGLRVTVDPLEFLRDTGGHIETMLDAVARPADQHSARCRRQIIADAIAERLDEWETLLLTHVTATVNEDLVLLSDAVYEATVLQISKALGEIPHDGGIPKDLVAHVRVTFRKLMKEQANERSAARPSKDFLRPLAGRQKKDDHAFFHEFEQLVAEGRGNRLGIRSARTVAYAKLAVQEHIDVPRAKERRREGQRLCRCGAGEANAEES